jgi:hypothetical protein
VRRLAVLFTAFFLCGCQITIDPVIGNADSATYYGLQATFTVSPNVTPDLPHDEDALDVPESYADGP